MGAVASQIASLTIVYSTVDSDADQRSHQSSASLAFVRGIHRGSVNSPHKWSITRKMFRFDDVIMAQKNIHGNTHEYSYIMLVLSFNQSLLILSYAMSSIFWARRAKICQLVLLLLLLLLLCCLFFFLFFFLGGSCNTAFLSETHLKLKYRKITFSLNLFRDRIVLKFCTEHGSITNANRCHNLYKISKRFDNWRGW